MDNLWKLEHIFSSYESANKFKKDLLTSPSGAMLQVKIRRCKNNNKEIFLVKSRTEPSLLSIIQEVEEQLLISKNKIKKK